MQERAALETREAQAVGLGKVYETAVQKAENALRLAVEKHELQVSRQPGERGGGARPRRGDPSSAGLGSYTEALRAEKQEEPRSRASRPHACLRPFYRRAQRGGDRRSGGSRGHGGRLGRVRYRRGHSACPTGIVHKAKGAKSGLGLKLWCAEEHREMGVGTSGCPRASYPAASVLATPAAT